MVFVPVCQHQRRQVIAVFFKKIEIGNGNIDTEGRFLGKAHAGINNDHLIAVPDAHAVHPEFADAAERYDF